MDRMHSTGNLTETAPAVAPSQLRRRSDRHVIRSCHTQHISATHPPLALPAIGQ